MIDLKNKLQGIYLVIDPSVHQDIILPRITEALDAGIDVLQIWNNWPTGSSTEDQVEWVKALLEVVKPYEIPVLINEQWDLLLHNDLHGVHFDQLPNDLNGIRTKIGRDVLVGVTCGNDPALINVILGQEIDYLSFCSMFPSSSVDTCEIVRPESVLTARKHTQLPIFLSGGIKPNNIKELNHLDFQGVAIISGIMNAPSITESIKSYKQALEKARLCKNRF